MNWTRILDQVAQIRVKSVTDSLFKYGTILMIIGVTSGADVLGIDDWISIVVISIGGLLITLGIVFYIYFAKNQLDYLRSENYQLKKQTIELLGDNERAQNENLRNVHLIMNPESDDNELKENPLKK